MRHLYLIFMILLLANQLHAQSDSTFSIFRNGVEAKFPFRKFDKPEQLRNISQSSLPFYNFNRAQYTRIKNLLITFTQLEGDYQKLLINRNEKDSAQEAKAKALSDGYSLQEQRAKNFEASYNSLLSINTKLNDQLRTAEQLAVREHKRRKFNSILVFVGAFVAGALIGAAVR